MFIPIYEKLGIKPENLNWLNFYVLFHNKKDLKDLFEEEKKESTEEYAYQYEALHALSFADPKTKKRLFDGKPTKYDGSIKKLSEKSVPSLTAALNYDAEFVLANPPGEMFLLITGFICGIVWQKTIEAIDSEKEENTVELKRKFKEMVSSIFPFALNRLYEFEQYVKRKVFDGLEGTETVLEGFWNDIFSAEIFKSMHLQNNSNKYMQCDLVIDVIFLALLSAEWEVKYGGSDLVIFTDFGKLLPKNDNESPRSLFLEYLQRTTGRTLKDLLSKNLSNHDSIKKTIRDAKTDKNNGKFCKFISISKMGMFLSEYTDDHMGLLIQAYGVAKYLHYYHTKQHLIHCYHEIIIAYDKLVAYFKSSCNFDPNLKIL